MESPRRFSALPFRCSPERLSLWAVNMSKPVDYCTVEFDFLTGGAGQASRTFLRSLTSSQRFAYICAWNYAVHLRRCFLTSYEIESRLPAIYDIDSRTVANMLQRCCKDEKLIRKEGDNYIIAGVDIKHGKLGGWKAAEETGEEDSLEDSKGEERKGKDKHDTEGKEAKKKEPAPPYEEISEAWNDLCRSSGLTSLRIWSDERKRMISARWKEKNKAEDGSLLYWFRDYWREIFLEAHRNEWTRENRVGIEHVLRPKNALRYYESFLRRSSKKTSKGFMITVRYSDGTPPESFSIRDKKELEETVEKMGLEPLDGMENEYLLDVEAYNKKKGNIS